MRHTLRKSLALGLVLAAGLALGASQASAAIIVLDFERISPHPHANNNVFIQNYYNGGTSSIGTSGPNYGIGFSANSLLICLNTTSVVCSNTSRGGQGSPTSQLGALFFLSGSESIMNVAAGFDTGFSFNYVSLSQPGSVAVFDGLNGTGNQLAFINLLPNAGSCPGYGGQFCPFSPVGVAFAGVAKSVSFAGVANQIVFDDITFGSEIPDPDVPEPASAALLGTGLAVAAALRRRARKA
jgi:hypothetical protein